MTPDAFLLRDLDPVFVLGPRATLRDAFERMTRGSEPVLAFDGGDGWRALSALELRFVRQGGEPLERFLAGLPDSGLLFAEEAAARAHLEREPRLAGALVDAPGGLRVLERPVPCVENAVVMAGGFGSRLRPLTDEVPKPLLEVGGRVLLFRILDALAHHGVRRAWISIHHLGEQVREAVGNGARWGIDVRYLEEARPLGTGAGLAMLGEVDGPFFVVNGDLLTNVDFGAMGRAHRLSGAAATVATYLYPTDFPYGIVHASGPRLERIEEKPILRHPVNAGMYVFSPDVLDWIEYGAPLAMVDFLNEVLIPRQAAATFPVVEHWNDVGTHQAFERAQEEAMHL